MNAHERRDARLAALEQVADAASAVLLALGMVNPGWERQPEYRLLKDLKARLREYAVLEDVESEEAAEEVTLRYVGPRLARHGPLQIVRGERTACDLPIQGHWVEGDPVGREVCRACVAAEASRGAV